MSGRQGGKLKPLKQPKTKTEKVETPEDKAFQDQERMRKKAEAEVRNTLTKAKKKWKSKKYFYSNERRCKFKSHFKLNEE